MQEKHAARIGAITSAERNNKEDSGRTGKYYSEGGITVKSERTWLFLKMKLLTLAIISHLILLNCKNRSEGMIKIMIWLTCVT